MIRNYLFPAAFMANTLAMTALLILLGLAGESVMAADVGIVQGATLALFYSFSANARNLILNQVAPVAAQPILVYRAILLLPLAGIAYWLGAGLAGVDPLLTLALILRRGVEWVDEIFLSEMERLDRKRPARAYIVIQAFLLLMALFWILGEMPYPLLGLFLWALLPLLIGASFYGHSMADNIKIPSDVLQKLYPHIGSTAIIGVTVYVFRLLLIDVTGKAIAGDLFAAFAIGGVLGSVFASAFGPTLALHQGRHQTHGLPRSLQGLLLLFAMSGIFIAAASTSLHLLNKTPLFWQATGLSMIGAVLMVFAQVIRHRLLQHQKGQDLFGPDVLMNVLIVAAVPLAYYLFGLQAMGALYLLSSLMALVFYKSYEVHERGELKGFRDILSSTKTLLAFTLFLPLFFQANSGLFHDPAVLFDSNGELDRLPIPFSGLACYAILVVFGAYRRAAVALTFVFFSFILMIGTSVAGSEANTLQQESKLILLIQFILPMFALVSGQLFENQEDARSSRLEKAFFYVLILMVPLQIVCSWIQGYSFLSPSVYLFSIYQQLHYVPVLFVAVFIMIFHRLWDIPSYRKLLLIMILLMAIYVAMTTSVFITGAYLAGLFAYVVYYGKRRTGKSLPIFLVLACLISTLYLLYGSDIFQGKYLGSNKADFVTRVEVIEKASLAVGERINHWTYYSAAILDNFGSFLIGHAVPLNRAQFPSAYNYYLDFIYNFGFLAILPLFALMGYAFQIIYKNHQAIYRNPALFFPGLVVIFLLLVENSFYVGLRQPYPGILTFFIWGILLNRILDLNQTKGVRWGWISDK